MLIDLSNAALRLLLAPECAACACPLDRPLAGPVCARCWMAVATLTPPWCPTCGDALASGQEAACCSRCRRQPPVFAVARSAGRYDGALRAIVHAFKYGGRRVLAAPLGALLCDAGRPLLDDADAVVPVPLHPWRALRRGFNQADDLAGQLGRPVWRVLRRRRHGPPQARLPASRRRDNVREAYALRRLPLFALGASGQGRLRPVPVSARALVRGRVLVLVDDVMTTGATLDACSRVLLDAGAASVRALTAARAVAGRPLPPRRPPDPSAARRR